MGREQHANADLEDIVARAAELRAKYRRERDKRLQGRSAPDVQHAAFADFDLDPFADPSFVRSTVVEETDVAIIGAGFGGMMVAAHLHKNGVDKDRIIDKAVDLGGTWYWNRYPGCMCDVESYTYLPLLEETGYMPKHKYAHASEIFGYAQLLGRHFDMYERAIFQTEVTDAVWNADENRWLLTTNRGDRISTRFFVICGGVLHKAKLPGIPGIADFQGEAFHTSRWDYTITGG